ncbi:MAG: hypothetical protein K0R44_1749, partial [Thermomicrobiales bacterium]|nr:hypothetical protein [Thermomicrobiales bacterium]
IEIGVQGRLRGLFEEGWARKIRKSLTQVDGAMLIGQPAHFGKHRGAETTHAGRRYIPGQIRWFSSRPLAPGDIIGSVQDGLAADIVLSHSSNLAKLALGTHQMWNAMHQQPARALLQR